MAHIKHTEKETGLSVPLDKEGADYMMVLSSAEIADFSEIIPAVTRIFHQAGVSWTMASDGFEGTNSGIQIGSSDLAAELVSRIVKAAERLKVKYVISPECGHAYTALRWEGPNLIGRPYPFEVVHIIELLDQLRGEGRLAHGRHGRHAHDFSRPMPDGAARRRDRSAAQPARHGRAAILSRCPMRACRTGAAAAVAASAPIERADTLRLRVFNRKKAQLDAINVDTIVTSCSNCRNMLQDGLEHNHMDMNVVGLTELIAGASRCT